MAAAKLQLTADDWKRIEALAQGITKVMSDE
jgi:hypothetical protein